MQVKRATSWCNNFERQDFEIEPVNKRTRYAVVNPVRPTMDNKIWGFDNMQSEHVMNMVSSELEMKLQRLKREVLELEKAKLLREAEVQHDSRREYVEQFINFWKTQEEQLTMKISEVNNGILYWKERLQEARESSCDDITLGKVNSHQQGVIELLEQSDRLQGALDFVKHDSGSLQEALNNIESLSLDNSKDQQNMDLIYLRRMYPRS